MNFRTYLISSIAISIFVIAWLYLTSEKPNQNKNGFNRQFINKSALLPVGSIDLKSKALYIAGTGNSTIYLGNILRPEKISYTNDKLRFMDSLILKVDYQTHIAWKLLMITVDSPLVYAHEVLTPRLIKGTVAEMKMRNIPLGKGKVSEIKPIKNNALLVKTFDTSTKKYVIRRIAAKDTTLNTYYFTEKENNPFRSSGLLLYNMQWDEIIYTYCYKNGYLRLDSQLNEKSNGKTIDTVFHFNARTGKIKSENSIKLLAGSVMVNKKACTFQDRLYIISDLNSDNFSLSEFNKYTVIDVYDYRASKYLHSFYLKKYQDLDFYDFCVIKDEMFVLYGNFLVRFDISE